MGEGDHVRLLHARRWPDEAGDGYLHAARTHAGVDTCDGEQVELVFLVATNAPGAIGAVEPRVQAPGFAPGAAVDLGWRLVATGHALERAGSPSASNADDGPEGARRARARADQEPESDGAALGHLRPVP